MSKAPPSRQPAGPEKDMALLVQGCRQLGLALTPGQIDQFRVYYEELVVWNEKFNLTAITGYEEVQTKHFLDSLVGLPILKEELRHPALEERRLSCLDIGTGAGFPGVPLKLAMPHLSWTLVDGTGKKISFLKQLVARLGLTGVRVVQGRAEELGRIREYRERYDLATARAVAPLNTLIEYLLPFVRPGGLALMYKGASAPQEFVAARKAIELLGGETIRLAPVQVPYLNEKRFIILIKKIRATPSLYPRGQGLARKKPLG
jgi:16S rRNA (guanine527-N7)-methyltransferase